MLFRSLELPHSKHVQTRAGYIVERLDRFPQDREVLEIPEGKMSVEAVYRNKIRSLRYVPKQAKKI